MAMRDEVEIALAALRRRKDEAEAQAGHAAEELVRLASGMVPLTEVDADAVRAAADTYAEAAQRVKMLDGFARQLRRLLI